LKVILNIPQDILLPESIINLITCGIREVNPEKVILFGSRAKKNERVDSDFDLAFQFDPSEINRWNRFVFDLDEHPITLRKIDLIDFNSVKSAFKAEILAKGIVIYEKNNSTL
jgi:uncharacterized protein